MTGCDCPRCNEPVSIPYGTGEQAIVCCPLCREEFPLSEALQQLPPMLVVVDPGPGAALGEPTAEDGIEDEYQLADEKSAAGGQSFDFAERGGAGPVATSGVATSVAPSTRRRKKQKNPAVEFAKIVVGGMLAIPIAQMILWWCAGDRGDPLDIGMKVGQYVPWILPARYHPPAKGSADGDGDGDNFGGTTGKFQIESFDGEGGAVSGGATRPRNKRNNPQTAAGGTLGGDVQYAVSSRQLQEALTAVVVADGEWERLASQPNDDQGEAIGEAARTFYTSATALGELLLRPCEPSARRRMESRTKDFLQTLNKQPAKLEIIARAGNHWLADSGQGPGILLVGVVEEMLVQGRWFETRIQLSTPGGTPAVLVSRENTTDLYQIGDRIAALGLVEREPKRLPRYGGEHSAVVVTAVSARLPDNSKAPKKSPAPSTSLPSTSSPITDSNPDSGDRSPSEARKKDARADNKKSDDPSK